MKKTGKDLRTFFILWSTQSLSQLGSAMTGFALTLWLYEETGSALKTALLSVFTYAPYILMSMFAGALIDRMNKKKLLLVCDTFAACSTVVILILLRQDLLRPYHLYILNAINGLMNTVQQPTNDVTMTLIVPKQYYQKTSGMRSFSQSLITVLHPVIATGIYAFAGMEAVIAVDVATFAVAFLTLLLWIKIPPIHDIAPKRVSVYQSIKESFKYLKNRKLVLLFILFMAAINLVASAFDATLPAMILPKENGGKAILAVVTSFAGIATLVGSLIVTFLRAPKDRVKVIYFTMLVSLSIEFFMLAFSREPVFWCLGQIVGWLPVPFMNANLDVIMRTSISPNMQGRIFACRNTLQYFTIPVGFFLGGFLIDSVCDPLMEMQRTESVLIVCFGSGKGSGAAMMFAILGVIGTVICLIFGKFLQPYWKKTTNGGYE